MPDSSCFSVLQATESWAGPGNEVRLNFMFFCTASDGKLGRARE